MLKIAYLAEAFAMKVEIHHGGNSINDVANLHVQMAIPNTSFMEVLLSHESWWHVLVEDIQFNSDGFVHALVKPGLGYEVDLELVERQKIAVLSYRRLQSLFSFCAGSSFHVFFMGTRVIFCATLCEGFCINRRT